MLDEIQDIRKAGQIFKSEFDTYPNVKFLITSSASFDLVELGKFLAGRVVIFSLSPFSFAEMLEARDENLFYEYRARRFSPEKPHATSSPFLEQLLKYLQE